MACETLSRFPDGTLLMVLHGDADPAAVRHVDGCADCTAELKQLRRANSRLLSALYRSDCPPSLEIGEFRSGLLAASDRARVAAHLTTCPHCTRELRDLDRFLAQTDAPTLPERVAALQGQVKVLIARLANGFSLTQPGLAPAFAGLRGDYSEALTYQAAEYRVICEVDQDEQQMQRRVLTGLVTGPQAALTSAHLWRDGQVSAQASIDSFGNFEFPHLEPGDYELILSGGDTEIHVQSLPIE